MDLILYRDLLRYPVNSFSTLNKDFNLCREFSMTTRKSNSSNNNDFIFCFQNQSKSLKNSHTGKICASFYTFSLINGCLNLTNYGKMCGFDLQQTQTLLQYMQKFMDYQLHTDMVVLRCCNVVFHLRVDKHVNGIMRVGVDFLKNTEDLTEKK